MTQPKPKWAPKEALRAHGAHLAQPSPPNHAQCAEWAFRTSLGFLATAVLVDAVGAQPQGVAGIVLGVGAMGVSLAYAHAHDRASRRKPPIALVVGETWALTQIDAEAMLTHLAIQSRSSRSLGGAQ